MSVKKRASVQDLYGALKPSLVRVYKTMGDYWRCKASARGARLGATQVLSLLKRWRMARKWLSQHMSVIQFAIKKDGSGGKKKIPAILSDLLG